MISSVVIGSGFGDEGKGLITDFEAKRLNAQNVCRFNGGAQAGHTVISNNTRHVFGHIASGAIDGRDTLLASRFIVNPLLLEKEVKELRGKLGTYPKVFIDVRCKITTPYDMAINAILELYRDGNRHGSCGVGINETVTRDAAGFKLRAFELFNESRMHAQSLDCIARIFHEWIPLRLNQLGLTTDKLKSSPNYHAMRAHIDALTAPPEMVQQALIDKLNAYACVHYSKIVGNIVFEGAQGLMLDEFLGEFPHVTRSITGLPYAVVAGAEMGVRKLKPIYVTRCYSTRHGAGKLLGEGMTITNTEIPRDLTNVPNPFQQTLRYAPLSIRLLREFIQADMVRGANVAQAHDVELIEPSIALTCLDQMGDTISYFDSRDNLRTIDKSSFVSVLAKSLPILIMHLATGPSAENVTYLG